MPIASGELNDLKIQLQRRSVFGGPADDPAVFVSKFLIFRPRNVELETGLFRGHNYLKLYSRIGSGRH